MIRSAYEFNGLHFNLGDASELVGRSRNFFTQIIRSQPELWELLQELDTSPSKGYMKYIRDYENPVLQALPKIGLVLKERNSCIYSFSKYLHKEGYYNNKNGFSTSLSKFLYARLYTPKYTAILKWKDILDNKLPDFLRSLEDETQ